MHDATPSAPHRRGRARVHRHTHHTRGPERTTNRRGIVPPGKGGPRRMWPKERTRCASKGSCRGGSRKGIVLRRGIVRRPRRAMGAVGPWRPGLVVLPGRWTERVGCQISTSDTPRDSAVGPWSHPTPSPCHGGNKPTDDEARGTTLAWRCTRVARSARIYSRCRCGWMAENCMEIPLRRNYCRSRKMHENKTKHHPFALRCIVGRTFSRGLCRRVVARLEGL